MSWKDRSAPGFFRDVPFFLEFKEQEGGRKLVKHEYPLRDTRTIEDLGLKDKIVSISCYVIGNNYIDKRDALINALEQKGSGKLSLPYDNFDSLLFSVDAFKVRESKDEGGIAFFSIDFVKGEEKAILPAESLNSSLAVNKKVDTAFANTNAAVNSKFVTQIQQFRKSGVAVLTSASTTLKNAFAKIATIAEPAKESLEELTQFGADLNNTIDGLILDADELLRSPFKAADRFRDLFESIFDAPALPSRNISALLEAYDFVPSVGKPAPVTSNRIIEGTNYDLLNFFIKSYAICTAARFAPTAEFESYESALDIRNQIADRFDLLIDVADDVNYVSLLDLRSFLINAIPNPNADLPRISSFTPAVSLPSLVITHIIYGNVDKELDLVDRNNITKPGFVLGGRELSFISNA